MTESVYFRYAKYMKKSTKFIVFEGIDGCGKSTQIKLLVNYLFALDKHHHIFLTRNPYQDVNIRPILRKDNDPMKKSELLADLFIKDRKKHAKDLIIPNIKKGYIIVCDRYMLSTIAYQSAQGMDSKKLIEKQKKLPIPDITFIVDVPAKTASQRMKKEIGRKEHKFEANLDFLEKTRQNYLKFAKKHVFKNIFVIDGTQTREKVFNNIIKHL